MKGFVAMNTQRRGAGFARILIYLVMLRHGECDIFVNAIYSPKLLCWAPQTRFRTEL